MTELIKKIEFKKSLLKELPEDKLKELDELLESAISFALTQSNIEKSILDTLLDNGFLDKLTEYESTITNTFILNQYKSITIDLILDPTKYEICEYCGNHIDIDEYEKITICSYCDDTRSKCKLSKILPRSKIGNFSPDRHFKTWIERIMGKESENELLKNNENIVELVKNSLSRKNKSINHLTIDDIRQSLKELNRTEYNKNASLIAQKITNRSYERLDNDTYNKIYSLFIKIMNCRLTINNNTRVNRIYYPYYIYKIFELYLPEKYRYALNYIHLHKETTIKNNDKEWKHICATLPELKGKYRPTVISSNRYI